MIKRIRPAKEYKVLYAYGPFLKGDIIQPTGIYRDMLIARGLIEELKEDEEEHKMKVSVKETRKAKS